MSKAYFYWRAIKRNICFKIVFSYSILDCCVPFFLVEIFKFSCSSACDFWYSTLHFSLFEALKMWIIFRLQQNEIKFKQKIITFITALFFFFKFEKTWSRKTKISSANEHAKVYFIFYPFIVSSFHKFNGPAMHLGLKIFSPVWKFCCLCLTSQQNYNRQTLDFSERVPISHWEFCQNFLSNWSNKWMLHLENIRNFDSK